MAGKQERWGWEDTLDALVAAGYPPSEVRAMTLAQVRLYTEAANRRYRRHLRDQAVTARAAQYDKSNFQKYLKSLDG